MAKQNRQTDLQNLPPCAAGFIRQVIKKMRYRKKVGREVQAELTAHFQDELKDCASGQDKEQKAQQLIAGFGDVKLLAVLLRRAKKRCRPLWRTVAARTLQTAGLLSLCLGLYVFWFYSGKAVISTDYVAELNRIVRPTADESLNAAPLYDKAIELYAKEPNELYTFPKWPADLSEQQMVALKSWLKANESCLEQMELAASKPHYWHAYQAKSGDITLSLLIPDLSEFRDVSRLMLWRAIIRAYEGQVEEALDDILICYTAGMHRKVPTTLVEQLVGIGIETGAINRVLLILDKVDVDEGLVTDFQRRFKHLVENNSFTMKLDGERLGYYDETQRAFTDGFGGGHLIPSRLAQLTESLQIITVIGSSGQSTGPVRTKPSRGLLTELFRGIKHELAEVGGFVYEAAGAAGRGARVLFFHPDKHETFEATRQLCDYWQLLASKSPGQIRAEGLDTEKETMEIIGTNILLEIFDPPFDSINERCHRSRTEAETLLTVLALVRYKNSKGFYPDNLQELGAGGHLEKLPMDPYSDKPLVYKKTKDNFILYSIGPNFKDDGGEPSKGSDGRVRKWRSNGDTVFWPLP